MFQAAFIWLAAAIVIYEHRKKEQQLQHGEKRQEAEKSIKNSGRRYIPILAGIVIALILIGLFALPMLMPSPMGSGVHRGKEMNRLLVLAN